MGGKIPWLVSLIGSLATAELLLSQRPARLRLYSEFLRKKLAIGNSDIDQASTSKYQPNISISTKLKLENLDQT